MNPVDIETIVGKHPYVLYGPEKRLRMKADELLRWKKMPENERKKEDVLDSMQKLYNLCSAYLIGAKINEVPQTPAYREYRAAMASKVYESGIGELSFGKSKFPVKGVSVDMLMKKANKDYFANKLAEEVKQFSGNIIPELIQTYALYLFPNE